MKYYEMVSQVLSVVWGDILSEVREMLNEVKGEFLSRTVTEILVEMLCELLGEVLDVALCELLHEILGEDHLTGA